MNITKAQHTPSCACYRNCEIRIQAQPEVQVAVKRCLSVCEVIRAIMTMIRSISRAASNIIMIMLVVPIGQYTRMHARTHTRTSIHSGTGKYLPEDVQGHRYCCHIQKPHVCKIFADMECPPPPPPISIMCNITVDGSSPLRILTFGSAIAAIFLSLGFLTNNNWYLFRCHTVFTAEYWQDYLFSWSVTEGCR